MNKNFIDNLNKFLDNLDYKYQINSGGCCYTAYVIAKNLKELGIRYKLVVADYRRIYNCNKLAIRRGIKEGDYDSFLLIDSYNHYYIKVDNDYINQSDFYDYDSIELGCINPDDIFFIYNNGDWNDTYDPDYNELIYNKITNYFKRMKKTIFKDVLNITLTESKSSVKNLTDKQLDTIINKLARFQDIVNYEIKSRNVSLEKEIEDVVNETADEVVKDYISGTLND